MRWGDSPPQGGGRVTPGRSVLKASRGDTSPQDDSGPPLGGAKKATLGGGVCPWQLSQKK